jgi:hypothetical protein
MAPMPATQEYTDIINGPQQNPIGYTDPGKISDFMTTIGFDMAIDEAVVEQAKLSVPKRYFETQQYWMTVPETENDYPWVFAGDGIPPNGAIPLLTGNVFPLAPLEGDYCLRTDYKPSTLFRFSNHRWTMQERNWRGDDWTAAHRLLLNFINNKKTSVFQDATTAPEKVALSKAIKPRANF